ncbi:MAG: HK97 family phage prohead protease [Roseovarius sp.]
MLHAFDNGELELRKRASHGLLLAGRFPYGKRAVLSDGGRNGGRPRKEVIAPRAFSYRVDRPEEDIHMLAGHDYNRVLASRKSGTLTLADSDEALSFEAVISDEMQDVSYVQDILASLRAGLTIGISPGFRLPPPRAVPMAEKVEEEDPSEGTALIRTIFAALLYELSIVTRPAYDEAQVEERNWQPDAPFIPIKAHASLRWR